MSQYRLPDPAGQPSYPAPQNSPYYNQAPAHQPPAYSQPPVMPYAPVYAGVLQPAPVARPKLTITAYMCHMHRSAGVGAYCIHSDG